MAYTPTEWKNREVEKPRTFQQQNNSDGTVTLLPAEGNIIEAGTPIVANNMNKMETGIKDAHDLAEQAFQSASDGKVLVAGAITGKGVPTVPSDTFQQMATNIGAIKTDATGDATAVAGDILTGKTAYARGQKLNGTMPNRGSVGTQNLTSQNAQYVIPAGYHDGTGKVQATYSPGKKKYTNNIGEVNNLTINPGFRMHTIVAANQSGGKTIYSRDFDGLWFNANGSGSPMPWIVVDSDTSFRITNYAGSGSCLVTVYED